MPDLKELLIQATELGCSDLHISVALPPMVRLNGALIPLPGYDGVLTPEDTRILVLSALTNEQDKVLEEKGEVDFSYVIPGWGRYRVNAYKQRRSYCAALRLLSATIPTIEQLQLPDTLKTLSLKRRGLVLITGPTGSGKSTTLAAMINYINENCRLHVLTIEDPIEYLHKHKQSMINQREVGDDTRSFANALRAALREDPDVILVGEMRDLETISTAISAAETGHLVLSTLHTIGAEQTVDRIIDLFPPYQQQQIRVQLASVLQGVMTQQLLLSSDRKTRVPAYEIMLANDAIANMIREGKCHQIPSAMQTAISGGMVPMDYCLANLVKSGKIDRETAFLSCMAPEVLKRYLLA